jgi:hypothetical protein
VCQIALDLVPDGATAEELGDILNPGKVLKDLSDKHANVLIFDAKDLSGQAFYHSSIAPQKQIGMGEKDLLREYIREAHKNDVKLVAYLIASLDLHMYDKHPEWAQVSPEGKPSIKQTPPDIAWVPLCPNSPFREYTVRALREIVENYEVDGVFLDMPQWFTFPVGLVCYCPYCREKFRRDCGAEIPTEPDWSSAIWRDFVRWRYDVITDYIEDLSKTVRAVKPEIPVLPNIVVRESWLSGWRVEDIAPSVDVIAPEIPLMPVESIYLLGEVSRHCLAAGEHIAVWPPASLWTPLPAREAAEEIIWEIVGNGGSPWFLYDPLRAEQESYTGMSEAYGQIEEMEEHLAGLTRAKGAALLYSSSSRDWYGGSEPARHVDSFKGFYQSFVENQVPFNMLLEQHLSSSELTKYPALVLPNVACMRDEQSAAIEQYVAAGGGLVACYESSLYDEEGQRRPDFALGNVFGISMSKVSPGSHHFRAEEVHSLTEGLKLGVDVPVGSAIFVKQTDRHVPARIQRSMDRFPFTLLTEPENPFIVAGTYGKGKVVYLSADVGGAHWKNSRPEYDRLILNSVNWVLKEELPFRVKAPMTVEANLFEDQAGTRKVLHLLNHSTNPTSKAASIDRSKDKYGLSGLTYSTPATSPVRCFVPVRDLEITLRKQPAAEVESISAFPADTAIKTRIDTETITIDVCELVSHATLVINFKVDT